MTSNQKWLIGIAVGLLACLCITAACLGFGGLAALSIFRSSGQQAPQAAITPYFLPGNDNTPVPAPGLPGEDRPGAGPPGPEADPGEDNGGSPEEVHGPAASPAAQAKANTLNRSIARFIDILFALLLARLPGYVGTLSGLTYIAIADGLMGGRSLGKKVIGLRAVYRKDGRGADFRASILRNSTIGALYLIFLVPIAGWVLAVVARFESVLTRDLKLSTTKACHSSP